jgi:hypothetical protein
VDDNDHVLHEAKSVQYSSRSGLPAQAAAPFI